MDNVIDISGLDKADVLRVLYNNSQPLGMGFLHFTPEDMTIEEARQYVNREVLADNDMGFSRRDDNLLFFDYLKGRVMKVNITGDTLDPWGYDRDNGPGAAARAIAQLR